MTETTIKAQSGIVASIRKNAAGHHKVGLEDMATMREVDALCPIPVKPQVSKEIIALQRREKISQTIFADHLFVKKHRRQVGISEKRLDPQPRVGTSPEQSGARTCP
jgi:DNA-binding transcriptional regulator YiaG